LSTTPTQAILSPMSRRTLQTNFVAGLVAGENTHPVVGAGGQRWLLTPRAERILATDMVARLAPVTEGRSCVVYVEFQDTDHFLVSVSLGLTRIDHLSRIATAHTTKGFDTKVQSLAVLQILVDRLEALRVCPGVIGQYPELTYSTKRSRSDVVAFDGAGKAHHYDAHKCKGLLRGRQQRCPGCKVHRKILVRRVHYQKNRGDAVESRKTFSREESNERRRVRKVRSRLKKKQEAMKRKEAALKLDAAMRSVDENGIALTKKKKK
jgi:hypothetical protein